MCTVSSHLTKQMMSSRNAIAAQMVLQELQKARRYIFVEYFIISKGILWDSILKILEQKAGEGVEVRILYDGMNSFSNLPHDYPKELEAKGIRCRIFNPIRPAISTSQQPKSIRHLP